MVLLLCCFYYFCLPQKQLYLEGKLPWRAPQSRKGERAQPHAAPLNHIHPSGIYMEFICRVVTGLRRRLAWQCCAGPDVLGSLDNENASGAGLASSQQCAAPVFVLLVGE